METITHPVVTFYFDPSCEAVEIFTAVRSLAAGPAWSEVKGARTGELSYA